MPATLIERVEEVAKRAVSLGQTKLVTPSELSWLGGGARFLPWPTILAAVRLAEAVRKLRDEPFAFVANMANYNAELERYAPSKSASQQEATTHD